MLIHTVLLPDEEEKGRERKINNILYNEREWLRKMRERENETSKRTPGDPLKSQWSALLHALLGPSVPVRVRGAATKEPTQARPSVRAPMGCRTHTLTRKGGFDSPENSFRRAQIRGSFATEPQRSRADAGHGKRTLGAIPCDT